MDHRWVYLALPLALLAGMTRGQACQSPLGMESGAIPDSSITASSYYDSGPFVNPPQAGRLNGLGWAPSGPSIEEWLQVDLGEMKAVTGIITQGLRDAPVGATLYKLQFSADGTEWTTYADGDGSDKIFANYVDPPNAPTTNVLDDPFEARYVRFLPQDFVALPGIRVEISGCEIESVPTDCSELYPGLQPSHNFGIYQDQCFWVGTFRTPKLNYMAAKQACQAQGGTLAMIKDEATQTFLSNHLKTISGRRQRRFWIGLDDLNAEKAFLWNDGTPLGEYDLFRSSAPHRIRDCVILYRTRRMARWDIENCDDRYPYICQLGGNGSK
ncbi:discoidin domain-containing receptor 2-like [Branchiostoma floridae]|uniref:Discoidin domain-containing receptor 2-like n=1 Tax=Branchiostoma floridae TaxID=7739 RepID=A0A9J7MZ39_BRAFL|nr:discoidin domain-containing receptor 2-like [Branchiostoma floridae]